MKLSFKTDEQAWEGCYEKDRWCFNKLEVARRFRVPCGLREEPIPARIEKVVVRPIYNLSGMGLGATIKDRWEGEATEEQCPLGFFWAKYMHGPILSVDYKKISDGESLAYTMVALAGFRDGLRFTEWNYGGFGGETPDEVFALMDSYEAINVEYIGETPIEIHLRPNPDRVHMWENHARKLIPIFAPKGKFISDQAETKDGQRLGFIIPEK